AIVGCAVVVVLLFGAITTDQERSIASLVDVLESRVGEKTAGVLLPNEKEVWQVSRELALRLQNKESELTPEELVTVTARLSALMRRYGASSSGLSEMGRKQMRFVMRALALTGAAQAVTPIAAMLDDQDASTRREALTNLVLLRDLPQVHQALPRMIGALQDHNSVVRATACVSISTVAGESDAAAVEALGRAYFDEDREVRWNAALALARLGSPKGRSLLLDMLDREYWEKHVRVRIETGTGSFNEYVMPPQAVDRYLAATIEAASHLYDEQVWDQIVALEADRSPEVKNAVRKVLERRKTIVPGERQ
ncbi:MAG: HEAT repeat domain-containing protein, partial [Phycisphaerae bacterium]